MLIVKSKKYIVGGCRIFNKIGGDYKRQKDFDEGLPIEVTEEEYELISLNGWCEIVTEEEDEQ